MRQINTTVFLNCAYVIQYEIIQYTSLSFFLSRMRLSNCAYANIIEKLHPSNKNREFPFRKNTSTEEQGLVLGYLHGYFVRFRRKISSPENPQSTVCSFFE